MHAEHIKLASLRQFLQAVAFSPPALGCSGLLSLEVVDVATDVFSMVFQGPFDEVIIVGEASPVGAPPDTEVVPLPPRGRCCPPPTAPTEAYSAQPTLGWRVIWAENC